MAKVLSPFHGHVGPLPSAGLVVGTFAGEYTEHLLASLLASCIAQPKPVLQSCGRDLQPYFNKAAADFEGSAKPKAKADSKKKERKVSGENTAPGKELKTAARDRSLASPRRPNKRSKSAPKSPPRVAPSEVPTCQTPAGSAGPLSPPLLEIPTGPRSVISPSPSLKLKNRLDAGAGDSSSPTFAGPGYVKSPPPTNVPMPTSLLMLLGLGACDAVEEPATSEEVLCS